MLLHSNAITEAFVPISVDPYLVWNYGSAGVLSFVGGVGFWLSFRKLDKQERYLNEIADRAVAHGQLEDDEATEAKRAPAL